MSTRRRRRSMLFAGVSLTASQLLLASEPSGLASVLTDTAVTEYGSLAIKDMVTPPNNYSGHPFTSGGGKLTFTRASTATRINASGVLEVVTSDTPRIDYDPVTLAPIGLLVEGQRTNVVLWNSDLTKSQWTKTNATCTQTQTGPDGSSNSATLLSATSANATVIQAFILASSARFQSAYVKRVTGSGTIEMTMDNGSTWTAISISSSWTRPSIPTATLANPNVGFRIVTSGDEIAVAGVQNENGTFASSLIQTTTASVTRSADEIGVAISQFPFSATEGTIIADAVVANNVFNFSIWSIRTDANNQTRNWMWSGAALQPRITVTSSGVTQADIVNGSVTAGVAFKTAGAYAANDFGSAFNGSAGTPDTNGSLPIGLPTELTIGRSGTGERLFGHIRQLTYIPRRMSDAELIARTA